MKKLVVLVALAAVLAACGGGDDNGAGGASVSNGESLVAETVLGSNPGCITCHSLDESIELIGPTMIGVATRAETRVPGQSAEEYLRESIVDPAAFVVEGYTGQMPGGWGGILTDQELDDMVAYLLTLR